MTEDDANRLATSLAIARRDARSINDWHDLPIPADIETGYKVNALVAQSLGWPQLGWKIAGTTEDVRQRLRLNAPIYGRTYQPFRAQSPARLVHAELLDPLVECEFFVTLKTSLPRRDASWTMDEIVTAIDTIHAGIEVAECRFPMADLPPLPAVLADGAASGRYVFGDEIPNWRNGLGNIAVSLEVDDVPRRQGIGTDVMGDPLIPLHWLAEERRRHGEGIDAGATISTGSMTGMLPVRAGQHVHARFGSSATVEITFD